MNIVHRMNFVIDTLGPDFITVDNAARDQFTRQAILQLRDTNFGICLVAHDYGYDVIVTALPVRIHGVAASPYMDRLEIKLDCMEKCMSLSSGVRTGGREELWPLDPYA